MGTGANGHFGQMGSWENGHGKNGFSNYGIAGYSTILNKCVGVKKEVWGGLG